MPRFCQDGSFRDSTRGRLGVMSRVTWLWTTTRPGGISDGLGMAYR
jgi:hypothetical protein